MACEINVLSFHLRRHAIYYTLPCGCSTYITLTETLLRPILWILAQFCGSRDERM